MLQLYALFKQATKGKCDVPEPGMVIERMQFCETARKEVRRRVQLLDAICSALLEAGKRGVSLLDAFYSALWEEGERNMQLRTLSVPLCYRGCLLLSREEN